MGSAARTLPTGRDPPSDVRADEDVLLAAILRDVALLGRLEGRISAEHFSTPIGERVFSSLVRRFQAGDAVTPARVAGDLGHYEWDEPDGADRYIERLIALPLRESIEDLSATIRRAAERRNEASRSYRDDVVGWAFGQARELARLSCSPELADAIDWANVIEEIRSVGRSEVSGVARRIELVFAHVMKALSSPDAWPQRGWRSEIELHLLVFQADFSPSMRQLLNLDRLWVAAAREAARDLDEYGERLASFLSDECPVSLDGLLSAKDTDDVVRLVTRGERPR